ncbi:HBL/NHE enterotoxin family protein [Rickettsiella endosymbiont of Rhagonycha lignosa]|uniref:HBL/NHE enterotoxin family protein n=1 Tax=Rickettsiella endosymbiont of Rhagonycha lignosa TaxID=3077937 RepID=UPI00313CF39C
MSCDCKELKVHQNHPKIYEKLARQNIQTKASVFITHENILQLARITNSKGGEAEVIIQPLVDKVKSYDSQFNKNCNQLFELIELVGDGNASAINQFKNLLDDISINVQDIQILAQSSQNELNSLREKISKSISNLATEINQLEIEQGQLSREISLLVDEIRALQQELDDLRWWWMLCLIPITCLWLPTLIQEVAYKKSQKQEELNRKTSELNSNYSRLDFQKKQQQSLIIEHNECNTLLASVSTSNSTCIFIVNNISGIAEILDNIDSENTPRLLRRQLMILQKNWEDLVNGLGFVALSLSKHS